MKTKTRSYLRGQYIGKKMAKVRNWRVRAPARQRGRPLGVRTVSERKATELGLHAASVSGFDDPMWDLVD